MNFKGGNLKEYLALALILVAALMVRLHRIDAPLADWHSWRQTDTAAVTRSFVEEGIDLLHPRYEDLSSIPSGMDNPQGWRFVEFPFVNAATAVLVQNLPMLSLEVWSRLTSIVFSLAAILALYLLVKSLATMRSALLASLLFALLPYNIYYHRTVLPEVPLLFFTLAAFLFYLRWLDKNRAYDFVISWAAFAAAMLIKPYTLFIAIPMLYMAHKKWGMRLITKPALYLLCTAIIPFLLWRLWALRFPEGIPAYTWLFNGSGIRFRPAFFRWIFAERLGKLILGYWGLVPFAIGVIRLPQAKAGWVFHWWLLSMLAYLTIFATGNVTHDYYQIFIIPPIAIFMAIGLEELLKPMRQIFDRRLSVIMAVVSTGFGLGISWFFIRDFFNINHPEIVEAGKVADQVLPPDAKVIAPYLGDTAFLYQTKRRGWPIGGDIEKKISMGATDYVTVTKDAEVEMLLSRCKPSISFGGTTIVSLRHCSL